MKTTLNAIKAADFNPRDLWKLMRYVGKLAPDDDPISIVTILESNGLQDALVCVDIVEGHEREKRLHVLWCARAYQELVPEKEGANLVHAAEQYVRGLVTHAELFHAWAVAVDAECREAQERNATDAWVDARIAYQARSAAELRRLCECVDAGIDPYPEEAP